MKPLPPARSAARDRADISGSSGRGNGIRSMITSWQVSPGTSRPCHNDKRAEQADRGVGDELGLQVRELPVALTEDRQVRHRLPQRLSGRLGRPPRREQAERTSVRRLEQLPDLVDLRRDRARRDPAAAAGARRTGSPARG